MEIAGAMTHVVPFTPRTAAPSDSRITGGPATIIIFPGVRYERKHNGAQPNARSARKDGLPIQTSGHKAT